MSFARDTLLRPFPIAWNVVAGVVGIASFFGIDSQVATSVRILGATCFFLFLVSIGMVFVSRDLYRRAKNPLAIRTVLEGTHFYHGTLIIILDRSNWIETGQLLALVANSDGVQIPLGLLTVETMTTEGFPQCVVAISLTTDCLSDYLVDRSRWGSLRAFPDIKSRYLEVSTNG